MDKREKLSRELERQSEEMNRRMEERLHEMEQRLDEMHRHVDLRRTKQPRWLPEEEKLTGRSGSDVQSHQPELDPAVSPSSDYRIHINLLERDEEFVLTAAVPGFSPDEVDVSLIDEELQIEATQEESEEQEEEGQYVMRERRRSMSRSIPLGAQIAEDEEISAHYENGVVTIQLPKAEPEGESVRQIDIE
ncbi:hypothetical protein DMJ13_21400 [halophilic archaeon]|nr:hypothetical protein DMJ13_21400 [halophilic archaeon]